MWVQSMRPTRALDGGKSLIRRQSGVLWSPMESLGACCDQHPNWCLYLVAGISLSSPGVTGLANYQATMTYVLTASPLVTVTWSHVSITMGTCSHLEMPGPIQDQHTVIHKVIQGWMWRDVARCGFTSRHRSFIPSSHNSKIDLYHIKQPL